LGKYLTCCEPVGLEINRFYFSLYEGENAIFKPTCRVPDTHIKGKMKNTSEDINNYLDYLGIKNYSSRSIEEYRYELNYFNSWLKEKNIISIDNISYQELLDYQAHLSHTKSKFTKKKLSSGTQIKKLIVIKEFFKYLIRTDIIFYNPAGKIKLPRDQESLRWSILSKSNIKKLLLAPDLKTVSGYRNRTILEILYTTGMRATELCNLKIEDIDYENNIIHIHAGKGNKDRSVPACDRALRYLKHYINKIRNHYANKKSGSYIFISWYGNQIGRDTLKRLTKHYAEKCELKKAVTSQCFRIACATHMLKNGADIRYIQQLLGHSVIDTTMKYLKLEKSELKKIHNRTHPREARFRENE